MAKETNLKDEYEFIKALLEINIELRMDYIDYRNGHLRGHADCPDLAVVNHKLALCQGHSLALATYADHMIARGRPEVAEMFMHQVNLPYPK